MVKVLGHPRGRQELSALRERTGGQGAEKHGSRAGRESSRACGGISTLSPLCANHQPSSSCWAHSTICLFTSISQRGRLRLQRKNVPGDGHRDSAPVPPVPQTRVGKESGALPMSISVLACVWPEAPVATRWSEEAKGDPAALPGLAQEPPELWPY